MTTITMTFWQLQKICVHQYASQRPRCAKEHGLLTSNCTQANCPIWRLAERKAARAIKWLNNWRNDFEARHQTAKPLVFGPGSSGMYEKKPHPIAGDAMADYCECCHKTIKGRTYRTKDDVLLCRKCHGELANEPVGRSGTPLVRGGKIVRLPKKRTCGNCGRKKCACRGEALLACESWKQRRG